jgi:hypothetical protein
LRVLARAGVRAIYLHGSLALGCFMPGRSDVDLLVIVDRALEADAVRACADLLLASSGAPAPVEISVMMAAALDPFAHPAPFEFHFSEDWRAAFAGAEPIAFPPADPDLTAHLAVTRARGVALVGPPPAAALPAIPREALRDALARDIFDAEHGVGALATSPSAANAILNVCRSLAWQRDGALRSKDEGALWAVIELPWRHASLAARALEQYRTGRAAHFDADELRRFVAFVEHEWK